MTNFLTGSENTVDPGERNIRNTNDVPSLCVSTVEAESINEIEGKEPGELKLAFFPLCNRFFNVAFAFLFYVFNLNLSLIDTGVLLKSQIHGL